MNSSCVISLVAAALVVTGCASLFTDPLEEAYMTGKISRENYETRCLERDATLARQSAAHWELQQTFSQNRANLPVE